jgi:hypothetical protein
MPDIQQPPVLPASPTAPLNAGSTSATPAVQGTSYETLPTTSNPFPTLGSGPGVVGASGSGVGVMGSSKTGYAGQFEGDVTVAGNLTATNPTSGPGVGVLGVLGATPPGFSPQGGVVGTTNQVGAAGVYGYASGVGFGPSGEPTSGVGVSAGSEMGIGLQANSAGGNAIQATCTADTDAITATSSSPNHAAVSGNNAAGGYGLWASSTSSNGKGGIGIHAQGNKYAGEFDGQVVVSGQLTCISASSAISSVGGGLSSFDGDVNVKGTVTVGGDVVLTGSDCAEDFDLVPTVQTEPGTVMVLSENGALQPSQNPYDKRVAGVISGAGDYRPGFILGRSGLPNDRVPLALVGKAYCKADAQYGSIAVGDLLTTSPTSGHAMRAVDPLKSFGAVIGKALKPLPEGQSLIPILVALQ